MSDYPLTELHVLGGHMQLAITDPAASLGVARHDLHAEILRTTGARIDQVPTPAVTA